MSVAAWLVPPSHCVGGAEAGREWTGRWGSHPEVLVLKYSPLHREGIELLKSSVPQRANGVLVQLAPVGST